MNRALNISKWIVGIAAFVFLLSFENYKTKQIRVTKVDIALEQPKNQLFLTREDIRLIIDNQYDSIDLKEFNAINTNLLEESIENHPFVADAEVFSTLDGVLSIKAKQKQAMARVINKSEQFYLDTQGHAFPTSRVFSAPVTVFTGTVDSTTIPTAFQLMNEINQQDFYKNYLAEIFVAPDTTFELIPANGRHRVIFGDTTQLHTKLKKLEYFYKNVVTEDNLNEWKTLNVAYDKQLVSTKY